MRAALVTPLTGPLALYGTAGARALQLWADGEPDGAEPITLTVHDAHPDPAEAIAAARATDPDLLFGPYGSGPARAMARLADRLWWNHGGAAVDPSAERTARHVDVLGASAGYLRGAVQALVAAAPDLRSVLVLHSPSGFGRAVGGDGISAAHAAGLQVTVREVASPVELFELPPAEIVLAAGDFALEQAVAEMLLDQVADRDGWYLRAERRAAVLVSAGTAEVLERFEDRREGLLGPAQWLAAAAPTAPQLGPSPERFAAAYRARHGEEPSYPAAQAYAAGVLAAHCLAVTVGGGDDAVWASACALDTTTLFGAFRLDPATGAQIGHGVVTVQWQDGARVPVWPPGPRTVPIRVRD